MAPMKRPAAWDRPNYYQGTWSLRETARRLAISEKELRALLIAGQLDFVQIAGQIRIPIEHVQRRLRGAELFSGQRGSVRPR